MSELEEGKFVQFLIDEQLKIIELINSQKDFRILDVQITFCNVFILLGSELEQYLQVLNVLADYKSKMMEISKEIKKIIRMQTHMNYGLLVLVEKINGKFAIYYVDEELLKFVELCEIELENVKDFAISIFKVNGLIGLLTNHKNELFKFSIHLDQNEQNIEKSSNEISATICSLNSGAYHFLILDSEGTVFSFGNNSYMQCGISHEINDKIDFPRFIDDMPLPLEILKGDVHISKACCGASHTLLLSQDNCLYVMGSNTENQCGISCESSQKILPGPVLLENDGEQDSWDERIVDSCCGPNYSVILLKGVNENTCLVSGKRLGFAKLEEFTEVKRTKAQKVYCSSLGSFIVLSH